MMRRSDARLEDKPVLTGTAILALLLVVSFSVSAGSIAGSKHDLSITGAGPVAATSERQVCVFCHTPHRASANTPLWNRAETQNSYVLYHSSTAQSQPRQPEGGTLLCLSCHDGTVAVGNLVTGVKNVANTTPTGALPFGRSNLSTDLGDDHPVGVPVPLGRAGFTAPVLSDRVKLRQGLVECTTCHNPHDPEYVPFLVKPSQEGTGSRGGNLCFTCHRPDGWVDGGHASATAVSVPLTLGLDPDLSVAQAACDACHRVHTAGTGPRLIRQTNETACLACHDGLTGPDIVSAKTAQSRHAFGEPSSHDPAEELRALPKLLRHAECADCHNPHATVEADPLVDGVLPGSQREVRGVLVQYLGAWSEPGILPSTRATAQYEICFKCHSSYSYGFTAPVSPSRLAADGVGAPVQTSPALHFNPNNEAMHAIAGPHPRRLMAPAGAFTGLDRTGRPWSWESLLICTDCHGSDDLFVETEGVHGSGEPFILKAAWVHPDSRGNPVAGVTGTAGTQDHLCFRCHDYGVYAGGSGTDTGFRTADGRNLHGGSHNEGCATCHSAVPHGFKNRAMLVETSEAAPYNSGSKLQLPRDPLGQPVVPSSGDWSRLDCFAACHV